MTRIFAIAFIAVALSACSSMYRTSAMGAGTDTNTTKNSTDANKSANPAAVSPGPSTGK